MLKKIMAFALALIMVFSLAACGSEKEPQGSNASGGDDKIVVGLSLATTTNNPYVKAVAELMKAEMESKGWTVNLQDADMDSAKQSSQFDNLVTQGVDVIVYWPNDEQAAVADAKKAYDAGIPVINFFVEAAPEAEQYMTAYVGASQYDSGKVIAEYAHEVMGGSGNYVIVNGMEGASDFIQRVEGFSETLAALGDYTMLANEYTSSDITQAQNLMENYLTTYGDEIDFVLVPEDNSGTGAWDVVAQAGKLDDIKFFGLGGIGRVPGLIADGTFAGTIYMDASLYGKKAAEVVEKILAGEEMDYNQTLDIILVTQENAKDYVTE